MSTLCADSTVRQKAHLHIPPALKFTRVREYMETGPQGTSQSGQGPASEGLWLKCLHICIKIFSLGFPFEKFAKMGWSEKVGASEVPMFGD